VKKGARLQSGFYHLARLIRDCAYLLFVAGHLSAPQVSKRQFNMALLTDLRAKIGRKLRPRVERLVGSADDLVELAYWTERPPLRLSVPIELLRMQGGFAYGASHPFVQALLIGPNGLRTFYSACQPTTLSEYYGIQAEGRSGWDLSPWELPWYGRSKRIPPPGERGLSAAEGVSFYGPVTEAKLALEMDRLVGLAAKVRSQGYNPDAFGDIEGYVVADDEHAAFFVRGGKHRAAVLAALGHDTVQVAFRPSFPRLVHASDAAHWPLVRSGQMEISLAREVLAAYISGRTV
jgi:hypothetical protein